MILIVPYCEKGHGGGHLTRCIKLVKELRDMGREALLFIKNKNDYIDKLSKTMDFNNSWLITDFFSLPKVELIVFDRFKTPSDEFLRWKNIAPIVGIDEGGKFRSRFTFLIDILIPRNFIKHPANICSPQLMVKGVTKKTTLKFDSEAIPNVLISFGQEDSAGLGVKAAGMLSAMKNKYPMNITLLRGALAAESKLPKDISVIENIPNLAEHLHEYDLVITHYGITAYEALFAGTHTLLSHPGAYHKKLSKAAGFKTFSRKNITQIFKQGFSKNIETQGVPENEHTTLGELINSFSPIINYSCPVCNSENTYAIARFNDRTYRRCRRGGLIFMDRLIPVPIEYEKEYFFESYKKQYGKTYLEDFENIKKNGKNRLKIIGKILQNENRDSGLPTLLDIGCAYGPFLDAARDEGYSVFGIDPAKDAVDYVKQKLGITAEQGLFPFSYSMLSDSQHYSVITLWYVMEHFTECKIILNEIKRILKEGGLMAFSVPSFSGISGSTNLNKFLYESPADHFTVWSPGIVRKVLSLAGFKVKRIIITGHHPERFPIFGKFANNKKSFLYFILLAISRIFKLGDTFEVYTVKKEDD